jgi:MFS family permease
VQENPDKGDAWSPLRQRIFLALWLASIASNIGTWMHEVGAGWLMTSLSSSPMTVALVQVAGAAPMFFLALPAGALADIVDKRRYLIAVQLWMASMAILLMAPRGLRCCRACKSRHKPRCRPGCAPGRWRSTFSRFSAAWRRVARFGGLLPAKAPSLPR